jgi:hypothetical protein
MKGRIKMNKQIGGATILAVILIFAAAVSAQVAQGGNYTLEQSVIASGGAKSTDFSGNGYNITGTIGQPFAGATSRTSPYTVNGGFWTPPAFAPTAASVIVSGQVRTANGSGIRNAIITLTESDGTIRTATSTTFGYYQFTGITVGQTVILNVLSRRFTFTQPTQVLNLIEETSSIDFLAYE